MAKAVKPRRQTLNPAQVPMFTPDSSWVMPTELPDLSRVDVVAVDTEEKDYGIIQGRGAGWAFGRSMNDSGGGFMAGISAAWRQGGELKSIYVPVGHLFETENWDHDAAGRWLDHIYKRKGATVFMNADYDLGWSNTEFGIKLPPGSKIHDVGCQAMMIDENRRPNPGQKSAYSLDAIAEWCGVPGKDERLLKEAAHIYGYNPKHIKQFMAEIPARYSGQYAEQDAVATLLSHEHLYPKIDIDGMTGAYETEMALVPMVHAMRKRGIRVNPERLAQLYDQLMAQHEECLKRIKHITGMNASIDEIRQRSWLIQVCDMHGIDAYKGEQEGDESFGKDWMRAHPHELPRAIAEAKQCHEAATKFVHGYLQKCMIFHGHNDYRIHANINQFKTEDGGTKTHRFSYSDPPLQQMPSRPDIVEGWVITEIIAAQLRTSFEPELGDLWFAPDYSQQEYRLIVHYAYLLGCIKADEAVAKYLSDPNTDFHNLVVEMTGLTRRRAKDVNFAKAYGAGVGKFALMTGMEFDEAAAVMGQYDTEMPFVKQLNEICDKQAQRVGFIRMIDGARAHFDEWEPRWLDKAEKQRGYAERRPMNPARIDEARRRCQDERHPWHGKNLRRADTRKAMNRLIQGSAARQVKMAMRACWEAGYTPMIQMHDELGFSLRNEKDGKRIGEMMREVVKISVPMRVDEEWGTTWGTAKYPFREGRKAGKGLAPKVAA
jgi:DNA polymerase I-like protein with 3'-5' exonuclease and polymerase domains